MTRQQWIPWADTTSQRYAPGVDMGGVDKLVLHTTEGTGWPAYSGGASAPNLTMLPDFTTKTVRLRQHIAAGRSARALRNAGTYRTNRARVFQIELCGTSGWASSDNPRAPYRLGDQWVSDNWPEWYLAAIARVYRWLHDEWGVPYALPPQPFGDWRGSRRMTVAQFDAHRGLLGHSHVPGNDHTDPGRVDAARIVSLARGAATPAPVQSTALAREDEIPMDQAAFNRLMTNWAKSPEGRTAIAIASQSATYGHDVDGDKRPETVGQLTAETYRMVAAIKKKLEA